MNRTYSLTQQADASLSLGGFQGRIALQHYLPPLSNIVAIFSTPGVDKVTNDEMWYAEHACLDVESGNMIYKTNDLEARWLI